ncbi:MAG: hypothetical protein ABEL97_03055 [Salinibacter sp.]
MSTDHSPSPSEPTLYDPPNGAEGDMPEADPEVVLDLDLPRALAEQLAEVASHLGLSTSIVASRAVQMICDEIELTRDDDLSSTTLIQKYQTRLDLLHTLGYDLDPESESDGEAHNAAADETDEDDADGDDTYGWQDVDDIIGRGTTS